MAIVISCLLSVQSFADIPETLIAAGYREMYDLHFAQAHHTFRQWELSHPDDPLAPVSDAAAYLFSELDRLHILQSEFFLHDEAFLKSHRLQPDPEVKLKFDNALAASERISDRILAHSPGNETALYATILRLGLRSDYSALIEKHYFASLRDMKDARVLAEQLLARDPGYYDAYVAVGIENYILSLKPAPLRWLLRVGGAETDREKGIRELRLTAEHGYYLRPFARLLLAVAALRNNDPATARSLLSGLAVEFPDNSLYREELARLDQSRTQALER